LKKSPYSLVTPKSISFCLIATRLALFATVTYSISYITPITTSIELMVRKRTVQIESLVHSDPIFVLLTATILSRTKEDASFNELLFLSYLPPHSAEVNDAWSYNSTPPYIFTVWYLVKHRDNFTFIFIFTLKFWVLRFRTSQTC